MEEVERRAALSNIFWKALAYYDAECAKDGQKTKDARRIKLSFTFGEQDETEANVYIDLPESINKEPPVFFYSTTKGGLMSIKNAAETALSNDLILNKIFEGANFRDLANFRMVNRKWAEVANKMLSTRKIFVANEKLWTAIRAPGPLSYRRQIKAAFDELIDVIRGSKGFLANGVVIDAGVWPLPNTSIRKFLQLHGTSIKYVVVNYQYNLKSLRVLERMLRENLTNVEELYVEDFSLDCNPRNPEPFMQPPELIGVCLQKLTKLKFVSSPPYYTHSGPFQVFWSEVILKARNLQRIENLPCKLFDAVVESGKLGAVVNVSVRCYASEESVVCLEKFMEASFNFPSLTLLPVPDVARDSWSRLLEQKKEELTRLVVYPSENPIHVPILPNVSDLHLYPCHGPLFPSGTKLSETFPNLSTLHFTSIFATHLNTAFPDDDFANNNVDTVPSVSGLDLVQFRTTNVFKILSPLLVKFPNICHVHIGCKLLHDFYRVPEAVNVIWYHFRAAETIRFYGVSYHDLRNNALDTMLTGIPRQICKNILQHMPRASSQYGLGLFQTYPSILHLKNLKSFKIEFEGTKPAAETGTLNPFLTQVSTRYVFSTMSSDVDFEFSYDPDQPLAQGLSDILAPFSKYAAIKQVKIRGTEEYL